MSLVETVKSWPAGWATCPIFRKGYEIKREGREPMISDGKQPLGYTKFDRISPARTALKIEEAPDIFQAAGVWTGARSSGLVVLDVDMNLATVMRKYGEGHFEGPKVVSEKQNAAKFLFHIDQSLWPTVSDVSLKASGLGFEVLWGRQAVLTGAYPGNERKGIPAGQYKLSGDLSDIPDAPEWLIAIMQESKAEKDNRSTTKSKLDDPYKRRTREERFEICRQCLKYIPPQGGGEDFWWQIGAMVHSADLGDDGLDLWREWSQRDDEYAPDWADGADPCIDRWNAFKMGGGKTIASLIRIADEHDPERERFKDNGLEKIVAETQAATLQVRQSYLSGEELLSKAKELEEKIENPALLDQAKHLLALEGGRRDTAAIDRLLDADLSYERTGGGGPKRIKELDSSAFQYLIPGLLPKPWTLLIHADGGTGKTAMCQTLAKHISRGKAFNIHGGMVDVPAGKILWLNGDQNERILRRQFEMIDAGDNIDVVGEWDMQWYRRFCKYQKANKYDMVVIDSLDGCNDANPYEENKREFALPIKRLARRNGQDFPACTILIIHHNTKEGKFRGTSAIKAAVDETWNMRKVSLEELMTLSLPINTRMVTVEKSRDDREGHQMVFTLLPDYTYKIGPVPETESTVKFDTPNQHTLDVLKVMRDDRKLWTVAELVDHERVGGRHRKRAIQYGLERLEQQALIERCEPPKKSGKKGRPQVYYRAVGTNVPGFIRKEGVEVLPPDSAVSIQNDCTGTDLKNNGGLEKMGRVFNKGGSTPQESCATEQEGSIKYTPDLIQSADVLKNDCAGTDLNCHVDPGGYIGEEHDWHRWALEGCDTEQAVRPMKRIEAIEAMSDFDGCIDVSAEDV